MLAGLNLNGSQIAWTVLACIIALAVCCLFAMALYYRSNRKNDDRYDGRLAISLTGALMLLTVFCIIVLVLVGNVKNEPAMAAITADLEAQGFCVEKVEVARPGGYALVCRDDGSLYRVSIERLNDQWVAVPGSQTMVRAPLQPPLQPEDLTSTSSQTAR